MLPILALLDEIDYALGRELLVDITLESGISLRLGGCHNQEALGCTKAFMMRLRDGPWIDQVDERRWIIALDSDEWQVAKKVGYVFAAVFLLIIWCCVELLDEILELARSTHVFGVG